MRDAVVVCLTAICLVAAARAEAPAERHSVAPDLKTYPQDSAKQALESVLKALDGRRVDYVLAQLADPWWVDERVKDLGGKFDELIKESTRKLLDDPGAVKQLKRFLAEGEWQTDDYQAKAKLKDVPDRVLQFRMRDGRWYMENRRKPEKK
jgi:hypothetical protein